MGFVEENLASRKPGSLVGTLNQPNASQGFDQGFGQKFSRAFGQSFDLEGASEPDFESIINQGRLLKKGKQEIADMLMKTNKFNDESATYLENLEKGGYLIDNEKLDLIKEDDARIIKQANELRALANSDAVSKATYLHTKKLGLGITTKGKTKSKALIGAVNMMISDETLNAVIESKAMGGSLGVNLTDSDIRILEGSRSKIGGWVETDPESGKVIGYNVGEAEMREEIKRVVDIISGKSEAKIVEKLDSAYKFAIENPQNPNSKRFLDDWENGRFDISTGKLEAEFRELTQAEQYIKNKKGETKEEEKKEGGFVKAFGELRGGVKGVDAGVEKQATSLNALNEVTTQIADIKLAKRLAESPDDDQRKEFIAGLSEERRATIERLQGTDPVQLETEMNTLREKESELEGIFKVAGEDIQSSATKAEESIKKSRGLETLVDIAEVGKKDIEHLQDMGTKIGEAIGTDQKLGSKLLQTAGAIGKATGQVVGESTMGLAKVGLSEEQEVAVGKFATNQIENLLDTEAGKSVVGYAMEKGEQWKQFKKDHPEEAKNVEGLIGIIEGVSSVTGVGVANIAGKKGLRVGGKAIKEGVEKVTPLAKKGVDVAGKGVGKAKKKGADIFEKRATKKAEKKAMKKGFYDPKGKVLEGEKGSELLDKIAPNLTPTMRKKIRAEGRIEKHKRGKIGETILGTKGERVVYSDFDKAVAKTVAKNIDGFADMDKDTLLRSAKSKISEVADVIRPELKKVKIDPKKLQGVKDEWKKVKSTQANDPSFNKFGGKKMQRDFEPFLNKVGVIKGKKLQTADELWELSKKYDKAYDKIANYSGDDAMRAFQKDVWLENRKVLRKSITEALESSKAPKETKQAFEKMFHLKTAINNISSHGKLEKGKKGISGQIKDIAKNKIVQTGAGVVGIGALSN